MNNRCPFCEEEDRIKLVRTTRTFQIRGEPVEVDFEVSKCTECGEEFINPKSQRDPLAEAYRMYRKTHNMLQPEQIKELRKRYGMTQGELTRILGWGAVTLSRYENGALQDVTHDRQLKLVRDPKNLLDLIQENPEALGSQKRKSLIRSLQEMVRDEYPIERYLEELFFHEEASPLSGFCFFDMDKFFNCILYFCRDGLLKTLINKLLFYADFKHFKEYVIGITGARYIHLPHGPVPANYDIFLAAIVNAGRIEIDEISYPGQEYTGELYTSVEEPILSVFSDTELKILTMVKERFRGVTARALSEFSHGEKAYQDTSQRQLISYQYAAFLRI